MAAMTRAPMPPEHVVTMKRNSKGTTEFEITVRGYDLHRLLVDAWSAYADVDVKFPYTNSLPEATGAPETPSEPPTKTRTRAKP
jgi:hypothetical protein